MAPQRIGDGMPIAHITSVTTTPTPTFTIEMVSRYFDTFCSTSRNTCAVRQRIRRLTHSDSVAMRMLSRVARKK